MHQQRIADALVVCALIFFVDLRTPAELVAAVLYPVVLWFLYPVRSARVFMAFCALCTALNVIAGLAELDAPTQVRYMVLNRIMAALVLYGGAFLIYRLRRR